MFCFQSQPFFRVLSLLTDLAGSAPAGLPPFTHYILQKFWEVAEFTPQQCIEWLTAQVPRNKIAHHWTLANLEMWVEQFLMAHTLMRVRNSAAFLLVSLVPSNHFRQSFRTSRSSASSIASPHKLGENLMNNMSGEAIDIMTQIYEQLLRLLSRARNYVDVGTQGTGKLVPFFAVLSHCLISRSEKLAVSKTQ